MGQSIINPLYLPNDRSNRDWDLLSDDDYKNNDFRKEIEQDIDTITSICLFEGFTYSGSPYTLIDNSVEWQIKLKNLVAHRDLLEYPYVFVTSDEDTDEHIEVQSPEEFLLIYLEYFTFEGIATSQGTQIKEQLIGLSDEELEEFIDERIMINEEEI